MRLVAGALMAAAIAVLGDLHLRATPKWRSPALAATSRGLLAAWVEGPSESSSVLVRRIGPDLRPAGAPRRLGTVPPASQLALPSRGSRTLVLVRSYMDAILLATLDEYGRPVPSHEVDEWPAMTEAQLEAAGLAVRSGRRRVPLGQPEYDYLPNSGPCAWGRPWQAAPVLGRTGGVVACVEPAAAGRVWRIRARGGSRRELARLEGAHCPPGAEHGCAAAIEHGGRVIAAWVRRTAFRRSFVLARAGGPERVLDHEIAPTGVAGLGLGLVLAALFLRAIAEIVSMARIHRVLVPGPRSVVLAGQLREGRIDPARGWRMKVGATSLALDDGSKAQVPPGRPLVLTLAALRGDLPRSARAVGLFERVHAVGAEFPAEPPFERALRLEALLDAPVAAIRRSVRIRLAMAAFDAAALLSLAWALGAALGR
ncbi:MAG: hypothetical protein HYY06_01270 [Deltaproteobacteria bacterium]|nr:hypothetical protein [Deltaproteobacteria bacterium]